MIGGHPGGLSLTKRLLALTGKEEGTGENLLDLGAGSIFLCVWQNAVSLYVEMERKHYRKLPES